MRDAEPIGAPLPLFWPFEYYTLRFPLQRGSLCGCERVALFASWKRMRP